jgi:hypothetical protein
MDEVLVVTQGETWHMILPGTSEITTQYVKELTDKTVLVREDPFSYREKRFDVRRVKFVEKKK